MKTQTTRQLFAKLWAQGMPVAEIVKTLNISPRTVCYWRVRLKLPKRRGSGRYYA